MSWNDRKAIIDIDAQWNHYSHYETAEDSKRFPIKTAEEEARDSKINEELKPFIEKYPFAFYFSDGVYRADYKYFDECSLVNMKSMYFGRGTNTFVKDELAKAIEENREYSFHTTVNYDVSVKYEPTKQRCWYSEEYRGCGNGYYYIALNHSTALFCEKD